VVKANRHRKMRITILDKIHYAFIYFAYKSRDVKYRYRKGRGYRYIKYTDAAQRSMSLLLALTVFAISAILSTKGLSSIYNLFFALGSSGLLVLYLDFSISKKKLWKCRRMYPNSDKYLVYFVLFLISLVTLSFVIKNFCQIGNLR
jgi:hypothetical protein